MTSTFADRLSNSALPGYGMKTPVLCASTGNISISGASSTAVDGISPSSGDRVLLWQQTANWQNGVYRWGTSPGAVLVRDADFDGNTDVMSGTLVPVRTGGAAYGGQVAQVTSTGSGPNGQHVFATNSSTSDAISLAMRPMFGSTSIISSTTTFLDSAFALASQFNSTLASRFSSSAVSSTDQAAAIIPGSTSAFTLVGSTLGQTIVAPNLIGATSSGGKISAALIDGSTFGTSSTNYARDTGFVFKSAINSTLGFRFSASAVASTDQAAAAVPGSTNAFTLVGSTLAQNVTLGSVNVVGTTAPAFGLYKFSSSQIGIASNSTIGAFLDEQGNMTLVGGLSAVTSIGGQYVTLSTGTAKPVAGAYSPSAGALGLVIASTEFVRLEATGVLRVGTALLSAVTIGETSQLLNNLGIYLTSTATGTGPVINLNRYAGSSFGTTDAVQAGYRLGTQTINGFDGLALASAVQIKIDVDVTGSTSVVPGKFTIATASTLGVLTDAIVVNSSQLVTLTKTPAISVTPSTAVSGVNNYKLPIQLNGVTFYMLLSSAS